MGKEKDDTRKVILAAAKSEFADKGFSGARMSSIAEKAGANQALIHYYFSSKENLYNEVLTSLFQPCDNGRADSTAAQKWDLTIPQKLYALVYFILKIHICAFDAEGHRIFVWETAEGRNFLRPFVQQYIVPRFSAMMAIIEKGIEQGEFYSISPLLSVMNLMLQIGGYATIPGFFAGTPFEQKVQGPESNDIFFEHTITTFFKGIAPEGKSIAIPVIPDDLTAFIDSIVADIASLPESEFKSGSIAHFFSVVHLDEKDGRS